MARDYKKEYQARAEELKAYRRAHRQQDASRARARRSMGNIPAGHEVDHVDGSFNSLKREELIGWLKADPGDNHCNILSKILF